MYLGESPEKYYKWFFNFFEVLFKFCKISKSTTKLTLNWTHPPKPQEFTKILDDFLFIAGNYKQYLVWNPRLLLLGPGQLIELSTRALGLESN